MRALHQSPFERFNSELLHRLEQQLDTAARVPAAEVSDAAHDYTIRLELPGVTRESIDVTATDSHVMVSAERQAPETNETGPLLSELRYGTWSRSFSFPSRIERDRLVAHYRDGLLTITVPKAQSTTKVSVNVEG